MIRNACLPRCDLSALRRREQKKKNKGKETRENQAHMNKYGVPFQQYSL